MEEENIPTTQYLQKPLTTLPDIQEFCWGQIRRGVISASMALYRDATRLQSDEKASAEMSFSKNALSYLLDLFFQRNLRITYLDLRPPDLDVQRPPLGVVAAAPEPPESIGTKRKRYQTGTGCSAAYVADLVLHLSSYVQHLFCEGHLTYARLKQDGCILVDLFLDAKSHGFLGMSSTVTTCSFHFVQGLQPQSHVAWLPYAIMLGKDSETHLARLHDTLGTGEMLTLRQRIMALNGITVQLSNLELPVRILLTGDYACMRALFSASRSNYALPKGTSNVYRDETKRKECEYFGYGTPSVWCNATPAKVNSGTACNTADGVWWSTIGLHTHQSFPGLLHLSVLGVAGAIADAARALKKLCHDDVSQITVAHGAIPLLRKLFRDSSGNSVLAWDIFNEENHGTSCRSKSHHRADHTNVLSVLRDPKPVLDIVRLIASDPAVSEHRVGREITTSICNAMDIALCLYGKPSLCGTKESMKVILQKGQALDTQWVNLCAYHSPTSGIVAESGLLGTRFLPPYTAHNIAAHLFCQHSADAMRILCTRGMPRSIAAHWEFGGEHLNNLIASLSSDAKVFSAAFSKRAQRILRLAILNCYRRCILGPTPHAEFVNASYVIVSNCY